MQQTVYFLSDQTGITAQTLGHTLLTQFEGVEFNFITLSFINTVDKAEHAVKVINQKAADAHQKPIIIASLVDKTLRDIIATADALFLELFNAFIEPIAKALNREPSPHMGKAHSIADTHSYDRRISAIHFTIDCDDGLSTQHYNQADLIIVGVSRCGKTPTSLYLALQHGLYVANYPFTPEDKELEKLPAILKPYKKKLFGLTIDPARLNEIREERRPHSHYAALKTCQQEIHGAEALFMREGIPFLNTSTKSIEEISTEILAQTDLPRYFY